MPSRRRLLVAGAALLGGCTQVSTGPTTTGSSPIASDRPTDSDRPSETPSDVTPGDDPQTVTERDPRPLSVSGAWPQYGADAGNTGSSTGGGLPDGGAPYWKLRQIRSGPPVVADGRIYHFAKLGSGDSDRVTATQTAVTTARPEGGTPAFVCRNATDGRIEWTYEFDRRRAGTAAVDSGLVVAGFHDGVRAFDAESRGVEWHVATEGAGSPTVVDDRVLVPVSGIVDGTSYVRKPAVQALDLTTGSVEWTVQPPKRGIGVAAGDDLLAVLSWDYDETGTLAARLLADGSERWRTTFDGFSFASPTVADGHVYVSSSSDWVGCFALADGTQRWERAVADGPSGVAVDGGALYVSSGTGMHALDAATGDDRWTRAAEMEGSGVRPAVADDVVYAGANYERLRALDAATGEERWSFGFPETVVEVDMVMQGVASQPVPVEDGLFVHAYDGLYAFGSDE